MVGHPQKAYDDPHLHQEQHRHGRKRRLDRQRLQSAGAGIEWKALKAVTNDGGRSGHSRHALWRLEGVLPRSRVFDGSAMSWKIEISKE